MLNKYVKIQYFYLAWFIFYFLFLKFLKINLGSKGLNFIQHGFQNLAILPGWTCIKGS